MKSVKGYTLKTFGLQYKEGKSGFPVAIYPDINGDSEIIDLSGKVYLMKACAVYSKPGQSEDEEDAIYCSKEISVSDWYPVPTDFVVVHLQGGNWDDVGFSFKAPVNLSEGIAVKNYTIRYYNGGDYYDRDVENYNLDSDPSNIVKEVQLDRPVSQAGKIEDLMGGLASGEVSIPLQRTFYFSIRANYGGDEQSKFTDWFEFVL